MKYFRNGLYIGFLLMIFLSACGGATPTPTALVNQKPIPIPNVLVTVVPPVVAPPCVPPVPSVGEVSSYCVNPVKGLGGVSFVANASDPNSITFNQTQGNATCTGSGSSSTCTGPQNGQITQEVCTYCMGQTPGQPTSYGFACAKGYINNNGNCDPVDPKQSTFACPLGSHFDNNLQNCVDDATQKLASPCPPGYPYYLPDLSACTTNPYPEAYNCQYVPIQLGACGVVNKVPNAVPFCQNNGANIGGANIRYPAGSTLSIDVKGSRLDSCTPGATQLDGTQLFTCLGTGGTTFEAKLCTDANTCFTYQEALGTCAGKNNREPVPAPAPSCGHC